MTSAPVLPIPELEQVLTRDLTPLYLKVLTRPLTKLGERLRETLPGGPASGTSVAGSLLGVILAAAERADKIEAHLSDQEALMTSPDDRRAYVGLMLATARFLGSTEEDIDLDREALSRDLDWPAIRERAVRERNAEWRVELVAVLALTRWLETCEQAAQPDADLREDLLQLVTARLKTQAHPLLERQYVDAAAALLGLEEVGANGTGTTLLAGIRKRARGQMTDTWVQCKALRALGRAPEGSTSLARARLLSPADDPDDFFVRRHVLDQLEALVPDAADRLELLGRVLRDGDPSPHVRQGAIEALVRLEPAEARELLLELDPGNPSEEPCPEVRAALPIALENALSRREAGEELSFDLWTRSLTRETHPLPLSHTLRALGSLLEDLLAEDRLPGPQVEELALTWLRVGVTAGWPLAQRRQAEDVLERSRVVGLGGFAQFRDEVLPWLDTLSPGEAIRLGVDAFDPGELGRLLAWAARTREGLYASHSDRGCSITLGPQRTFRAWRLIHEARIPTPDKRTGFTHVSGWRRPGTTRAHSLLLAEESPARVPGEPRAIASEGGPRPFLPLVDDLLDCLQDGPSQLYSAQGMVGLAPPQGRAARWSTTARLWVSYGELAELREQCRLDNPEVAPSAFVERVRQLGFEVVFASRLPAGLCSASPYFGEPQPDEASDPSAEDLQRAEPEPEREGDA